MSSANAGEDSTSGIFECIPLRRRGGTNSEAVASSYVPTCSGFAGIVRYPPETGDY